MVKELVDSGAQQLRIQFFFFVRQDPGVGLYPMPSSIIRARLHRPSPEVRLGRLVGIMVR